MKMRLRRNSMTLREWERSPSAWVGALLGLFWVQSSTWPTLIGSAGWLTWMLFEPFDWEVER